MNKREMTIDLTPLLDVILIILFLVLANQTNVQHAEVTQLEAEVSRLQETQLPQTATEEGWYRTYQESIGKVNLIYPEDFSDEPLKAVFESGEMIAKPPAQDLNAWLSEILAPIEEDIIIVTFTVNHDDIYNQEYQTMLRVLTQLETTTEQTIVFNEVQVN